MLKGVFTIVRNNFALAKAGVSTQSIDPSLRRSLHRFGMQRGLTPEEVAAFYIRYELGPVADRMLALQMVHDWEQAGKLRTQILVTSHIQYVKQGFRL